MFSAASKSASGGTLQTVTFTSNTTWVAPTGVSVLRTMSGYGGAATADTFTTNLGFSQIGAIAVALSGLTNAPYAQWADLYADYQSELAKVTGNTGVNLLTSDNPNYYIGTDDTWDSSTTPQNRWVSGSSYSINTFGSPQTSGDILYSDGVDYWVIVVNGYDLGSNGAATTGVSKTFPGGTLTGIEPYRTTVAAVTTNFTNVPVTPGVSYPIVVPSGGSLTITFIG
jgi:hypothetical protein